MSSSKLQEEVGKLLDSAFPNLTILENHRPEWLISPNFTRLELDFYIPELQIAFEIQGEQHYKFVELFHGTYAGFEKQKLYDEEKKSLCHGKGIKLLEIDSYLDALIIMGDLSKMQIPENKKFVDAHERSLLSIPESIPDKKLRVLNEMQTSSQRTGLRVSDIRALLKWRKQCLYFYKKGGDWKDRTSKVGIIKFIPQKCYKKIMDNLSNAHNCTDIYNLFDYYLKLD